MLENAKTCMGPYCKACDVCNGKACRNQMPGPGSKGIGDTAMRNYVSSWCSNTFARSLNNRLIAYHCWLFA